MTFTPPKHIQRILAYVGICGALALSAAGYSASNTSAKTAENTSIRTAVTTVCNVLSSRSALSKAQKNTAYNQLEGQVDTLRTAINENVRHISPFKPLQLDTLPAPNCVAIINKALKAANHTK